jgi:DHA2 family multidrug resistance protein-like MFS transporter
MAGALWSALAMGAVIMAADTCARFADPGQGATRRSPPRPMRWWRCWPVAFVRGQRRVREPLLPLDIFSNARFSLAALTSLASFVGQGIAFVALPFLFQNAYAYSAFESAALFTPWPLGIVLVAPHAGRLADRHSPALLSSLGLAVFTLGLVLLALLPDHAQAWDIGWRALVCGMGFGFSRVPTTARCSAMSPANAAAMPPACWPSCAPSASAWAPRCWA